MPRGERLYEKDFLKYRLFGNWYIEGKSTLYMKK